MKLNTNMSGFVHYTSAVIPNKNILLLEIIIILHVVIVRYVCFNRI